MENVAEAIDDENVVEEALANFAALLDGLDYAKSLDMLGVGRLQFLLRKQMIAELTGLRIALWRLALARSFPGRADAMFEEFLARYRKTHPGKLSWLAATRAEQYWAMIEPVGDSDFNALARHLISFVVKNRDDTKALTLKLALSVRQDYRYIFDRLI